MRLYWVDILRLYLIPSLSVIPANAVLTMDIWNLVELFKVDTRWALYSEWQKLCNGKVPQRPHLELIVQAKETSRETKDILRRINSTTGGRVFSQPMSRMSLSNPIVVFPIALFQVLSYPNFPAHIADTLEYLTPLGFDVLTNSVLGILADPNRSKIKDDGTSLQDWIQSKRTGSASRICI